MNTTKEEIFKKTTCFNGDIVVKITKGDVYKEKITVLFTAPPARLGRKKGIGFASGHYSSLCKFTINGKPFVAIRSDVGNVIFSEIVERPKENNYQGCYYISDKHHCRTYITNSKIGSCNEKFDEIYEEIIFELKHNGQKGVVEHILPYITMK
ncbi:MAG: hypothetical protein ACI4FO_09320 [Acutalibacteraceae bacterium]